MTLSLVACGSLQDHTNTAEDASHDNEESVMSKEELLEIAQTITADALLNEIGGNKAEAKGYIGKTYCITGHVSEIEEEYAMVLASDNGDWNQYVHQSNKHDWEWYAEGMMFHVYLPAEELARLEECENIEFVGTITDTGSFEHHKAELYYLKIYNAFLVEENVEYKGVKH